MFCFLKLTEINRCIFLSLDGIMDDEMFLELVQNMLPYQDEIMDVPTTDDNTSMDEDDGLFSFERD